MIIGLSGYARSGKDEAARGLVEQHNFARIAFADKLRQFLLALNPIVGFEHAMSVVRVVDVVSQWGWDGYKSSPYGKEMRELMQRLGTECGRELISDTIWVDAVIDRYINGEVANLVIPDVRFPNEAKAIKDAGGFVIRVTRPGVGPANAHPSETALDNWEFDAVLPNEGTISDLRYGVYGLTLAFSL